MAQHVYVAENERFGKLDCRYCRMPETDPVHRSLTETILADARDRKDANVPQPDEQRGFPLATKIGPDVKARMEALIGRHAETREQYKARMLGQPSSRAMADAEAIVDTMAKLSTVFGVKRKRWADLSVYDQALWIATLRESGIA
jgi:hypothetical protein